MTPEGRIVITIAIIVMLTISLIASAILADSGIEHWQFLLWGFPAACAALAATRAVGADK